MGGTAELKTERLVLRRYRADDARALHEEFGINPAMYEYSGWNPYATQAMAEDTVRQYMESYSDQRFYGWAIERGGCMVGTIGAYDYDAQQGTIEVGMSIARASWGKGFATEALSCVLRYLTEHEGIARVVAWCASDNVGSRKAMERCGMVCTDTEAGALEIGGERFDKLWYEYAGSDCAAIDGARGESPIPANRAMRE